MLSRPLILIPTLLIPRPAEMAFLPIRITRPHALIGHAKRRADVPHRTARLIMRPQNIDIVICRRRHMRSPLNIITQDLVGDLENSTVRLAQDMRGPASLRLLLHYALDVRQDRLAEFA